MSRVANIILALLLAASLNASTVTSVLFFGRRSYENASYVQVICSDLPPDEKGRDHCEVSSVRAKIPHNDCILQLNVGSRALGPDSMEVVRFGDDKAILSWRVEESSGDQPAATATSWRRLGVVHLKDSLDCELHELALTLGDRRYVPVSVVANENSFIVLVFSEEPDSPCRMSDSDLDAPRCAMHFDERGQLVGGPRVWFYQTKRDDDMILEPLDYDDPLSGYLLIDTIVRPQSVMVRVSIVKLNGMTLRLDSYEMMSNTRSANPYDDVAYSTANGLIGVCVGNLRHERQLVCSQFDRNGKQTLEKSLQVERKNKYSLMNLAGGGMLLLSYSCRDPENLCELVDSISISVSRIEANGKVTPDFYRKNELYPCNRKYYRGEAQLFQLDSGHYCYTHVCLGYPKDRTDTDGPVIYTHCIPDVESAITPKIHPDDENEDSPKGTLYFDRRSSKNETWVTVYCGDLIHRDDGQTLCEVSRYRDQRLEYTCPTWLYSEYFKPKVIRALPFMADKAILSWQAYSSRMRSGWRLQVVHFKDCSAYRPRWRDWSDAPTNIVAYEDWFAAAVTSSWPGPCMTPPERRVNVTRCKLFFDERGQVMSASPLVWFVQDQRDDDMILEPLENGNPDGGHLLIETSDLKTSTPVFVRASIVKTNGQLLRVGSYELLDAHLANPHDGIAYSTANGLIGICVENRLEQIVCAQFDRHGKQTLANSLQVERRHELAVINLVEPGAMLLLHYVCGDPGSRCERPNSLIAIVSRIESDVAPRIVFSGSTGRCDTGFDRASAQLFVHEATGQYCFAQFCYRDSTKDRTDDSYRPVTFTTCLPEKAMEAITEQKQPL
ncbi:uncharacterized protein LOC111693371 [Trichogramma pretiosum]|uniref:uncharacterized protein LOC111693371 n=1 Tax=Trichogramma pretiosum TaxID=7493 RepID=UPI000C71BEF3|nr:uncharacterized protein LOC111693371 [Trichogramma pretiosum]